MKKQNYKNIDKFNKLFEIYKLEKFKQNEDPNNSIKYQNILKFVSQFSEIEILDTTTYDQDNFYQLWNQFLKLIKVDKKFNQNLINISSIDLDELIKISRQSDKMQMNLNIQFVNSVIELSKELKTILTFFPDKYFFKDLKMELKKFDPKNIKYSNQQCQQLHYKLKKAIISIKSDCKLINFLDIDKSSKNQIINDLMQLNQNFDNFLEINEDMNCCISLESPETNEQIIFIKQSQYKNAIDKQGLMQAQMGVEEMFKWGYECISKGKMKEFLPTTPSKRTVTSISLVHIFQVFAIQMIKKLVDKVEYKSLHDFRNSNEMQLFHDALVQKLENHLINKYQHEHDFKKVSKAVQYFGTQAYSNIVNLIWNYKYKTKKIFL